MVNRNFEYFDGTNMDTKNGIGLIERKKGKGMGSADIIYVKTCIKTCIGENDENYGKCVGKSVGKLVDNIVNEIFEPNTTTKNELLLEQNSNHSGTKNEPIEVQNLRPNNTELINNESNNINSIQINSKKNFKEEMELKGIENNRKSISEIKEEVLSDFNAEETLPYIYTDKSYHRHLKQAIQMLSEYHSYKRDATDENSNYYQRSYSEDRFTLVHIFSEALFKMLSTEGNQNVNGRNVTYSKVYDELVHTLNLQL